VQLDWSESRLPPFVHQREDTADLIAHPFYFITSETRTGKTKIVIDAAQFLYRAGLINRVVVVAPEPVRGVWFDPEDGELRKHLWEKTPAWVTEYHSNVRQWRTGPEGAAKDIVALKFICTNFEFLRPYTDRNQNRIEAALKGLLPYVNDKTMLVIDESSAITNHKSEQFKACMALRKKCGRVVLMNATPFDTPIHLFAQGNLLHSSILDCKYITHFRARYAVQTPVIKRNGAALIDPYGKPVQKITGWTKFAMQDLQERFAPYTVRRLRKDCIDMPEALPPVTVPVTLTPTTWNYYVEMRDQMVIMLENGNASIAQQTITKILRLAQITGGFIGGIADAGLEDDHVATASVREIGREKLDVVLYLVAQQLEKEPDAKIVTWVRFKPELTRMLADVKKHHKKMIVDYIAGGQKKGDRREALRLLKPASAPEGAVFFGGTFGTGSYGLDFSASHTVINCSFDYSSRKFSQAQDRVLGPAQTHAVSYFDLVARGPKGQRTIDNIILDARRGKTDLMNWTASAWVKALKQE